MTDKIFRQASAALLLLIGTAQAGQAATVSYDMTTIATKGFGIDRKDSEENGAQLTAAIDLAQQSGTADSSAGAQLSVDPLTGEIKFATNASAAYNGSGAEGSSVLDFRIRETFTATGTGKLTFAVALDGLLKESGFLRPDKALIDAELTVRGPGNVGKSDQFSASTNEVLGASQIAVDTVLQTTFDVVSGGNYIFEFTFRNESGASAGSSVPNTWGESDFLNTARITATAGAGVTVVASDANFLSGQNPVVGAVPLPASLPMLAGAFGLLAWRRRRAGHSV